MTSGYPLTIEGQLIDGCTSSTCATVVVVEMGVGIPGKRDSRRRQDDTACEIQHPSRSCKEPI